MFLVVPNTIAATAPESLGKGTSSSHSMRKIPMLMCCWYVFNHIIPIHVTCACIYSQQSAIDQIAMPIFLLSKRVKPSSSTPSC